MIAGVVSREVICGRETPSPATLGTVREESLEEEAMVTCPWCFEQLELYVAPTDRGRSDRDCDVCCRPWTVHVSREDGRLYVHVERA